MARPKNADSGKTLEKILEAARLLLDNSGVESVTLRRVAKEAGLSTGTVRYYFERQVDLIEACLDPFHETLAALEQHAYAALADTKNPKIVIEGAIRAGYQLIRGQQAYARVRTATTAALGGLPPSRRSANRSYLKAVAKLLGSSGIEPIRARTAAYSMSILVSRYAGLADDEIVEVTGITDVDAAHNSAIEHLIGMAKFVVFDNNNMPSPPAVKRAVSAP